MAINIKDPEADRMVRDLAAKRNQPITELIKDAIRALEAEESRLKQERYDHAMATTRKMQAAVAKLPVQDDRPLAVIRAELWGEDEWEWLKDSKP